MSFLVRAPDGEIVELGTGVCWGFDQYRLPGLFTDASTLLRHWDGYSVESLGSTPKIIGLSRKDRRLLSKIRPWKFFKQDYLDLTDKINRQRFSIRMSVVTEARWADPDSFFNSSEFRSILSKRTIERWADPNSTFNTDEYRKKLSESIKRAYNTPEGRQIATIRNRKTLANPRTRRRIGLGRRRVGAWKILAQVMEMLFGDIVDEDVETYPCPYCNRVFSTCRGVGNHIGHAHDSRILDEIPELDPNTGDTTTVNARLTTGDLAKKTEQLVVGQSSSPVISPHGEIK